MLKSSSGPQHKRSSCIAVQRSTIRANRFYPKEISQMFPRAEDVSDRPVLNASPSFAISMVFNRIGGSRSARFAWIALFLAFSGTSAQNSTPQAGQQAAPVHGIAIANMDPAVKPGDDFYLYADGAWIRRTEIPPDRSGVGVFSILDDISRNQTASIVEEAAQSRAPAGSNTRKIADLYNSFMNETAIEAQGLTPLKPHLEEIAAIKDRHQLSLALGKALRADVDLLNTAF